MSRGQSITLKEYESTQPWELNQRDLIEVEKLNILAKSQIFEIKANNVIKARQFVGMIRINGKNIQILPKIIGDENQQIIKNLLYMLAYTKKLSIKEAEIAHLLQIGDLFEVFIYLFAKNLLELLKRDFKKNYHQIEENSSFLKGKLLFGEQIKHNLFNKSKFFIEYEQMDENILLNIFLASTCQKLLHLTQSNENFRLLSKICGVFCDIEAKYFPSPLPLEKLNFNRQNKQYKEVFHLAKLLYFGKSPDLCKNIDENFTILFDMNQLFEEFIGEFLKRHKTEIDTSLQSVQSQVAQKYIFKENKFQLKPDLVCEFETKKVIIDTKYKKLDKNKQYNGVASREIYQMFAYGMRYFEQSEAIKKIILLYPDYDKIDYHQEYTTVENIQICVRTLNLNFVLGSQKGKNDLVKMFQSILE